MLLALTDALAALKGFLAAGGVVLTWGIVPLTFLLWLFIFERVWYFHGTLKGDVKEALDAWEKRSERKSWNAHMIREAMVSRVSVKVDEGLPMIKTMVALCPLFGLLGTVWGMIEVFNILAVTGGGDAKQMADGVQKATIPTMAGMVAALSGIFGETYLTRVANREKELLGDHLTMDH